MVVELVEADPDLAREEEQGRAEQAEREHEQDACDRLVAKALAIQEGNENVNPFNLSSTLITQGESLLLRGRLQEAEIPLKRALELRERSLDEKSALLGAARGWLGECLMAQGRLDEARPLLESNYEITRSSRPPGHRGPAHARCWRTRPRRRRRTSLPCG